MKWVILLLVLALIFAGVGGYILYARGLLTLEDFRFAKSEAGKQEQRRADKAESLTDSILERDKELKATAARLEDLSARLDTQRQELEAERALVEEKIQALKQQEERLKQQQDMLKQEEGRLKALQRKSKSGSAAETKLKSMKLPPPTEDMMKLVKVYEGMPPEDAAPVLENLPDAAAAQILLQMRRRQASEIMGLLTPNKAASVSRLLTAETAVAEAAR
ncbi:hypothetical protein HZA56_22570 [Candidatus Poribacteria bacterium]|nr:hypothetical protein [Candidatus Poribacteria bacterium]